MKNIFLIGMPSSGKTTLGKQLARHTRYRFLDTDTLIVKEIGMSISEIFAQKGESYFREVEARVLRSIRPDSKLIVSTGGGMPCFHGGIEYIKSHGVSVFLNVSPEQIAERMRKHAENDRPLFDKNKADLIEQLRLKAESRMEFYSQADFTISGVINVHQLLTLLKPYLS